MLPEELETARCGLSSVEGLGSALALAGRVISAFSSGTGSSSGAQEATLLHSSAGKHPFSKRVKLEGHQTGTAGAGVGWEGVPTASPSAVLNSR